MLTTHPGRARVALVNADIGGGQHTVVRIAGTRICSLGEAPRRRDRIVDLDGDRLLPGLINAHDHLALNSFPGVEFATRYRHAREWIVDVDAQRRAHGPLRAGVARPRTERLLLGAVKNLLSGVTTVAHHDPPYAALQAPGYPIHVVSRYGWSHSLYLDGEVRVRESYRRTPADWPWIIHAAEGLDREASEEFETLERLGCLGSNTLLVHGVALAAKQRERLAAASAGLIWCPVSNLRLFGRTACVGALAMKRRVALGTDSRLSGSRDLLEELRGASSLGVQPPILEDLVTGAAARLLHLPDRGVLEPGARADLLVLPAAKPLGSAARADVRLVIVDGVARYGDLEYMRSLAPAARWSEACVDGRPKALEGRLAALLCNAGALEAGLSMGAARKAAP